MGESVHMVGPQALQNPTAPGLRVQGACTSDVITVDRACALVFPCQSGKGLTVGARGGVLEG